MTMFRERAAIALYAAYNSSGDDDRRDLAPGEAVEEAQLLANAACREWGHELVVDGEMRGHCSRCGMKVSHQSEKVPGHGV